MRGAAVHGAGEDAAARDGGDDDDGSFMEALPPGVSTAGRVDDDEDPYMAGQAATPGGPFTLSLPSSMSWAQRACGCPDRGKRLACCHFLFWDAHCCRPVTKRRVAADRETRLCWMSLPFWQRREAKGCDVTCGDPACSGAAGGASVAQEAARAAFGADRAEGFYSSDDEAGSQSSTSLSATTSNAGGHKIKARLAHALMAPSCKARHRLACPAMPCLPTVHAQQQSPSGKPPWPDECFRHPAGHPQERFASLLRIGHL